MPRPLAALELGEVDQRRRVAGVSRHARAQRPAAQPAVQPPADAARAGARAPSAIRAATVADASGSAAADERRGATRGIVTHRSIRSRSGPETRRA